MNINERRPRVKDRDSTCSSTTIEFMVAIYFMMTNVFSFGVLVTIVNHYSVRDL